MSGVASASHDKPRQTPCSPISAEASPHSESTASRNGHAQRRATNEVISRLAEDGPAAPRPGLNAISGQRL
jgi:hypothetical protein